jgi:phosphopantothenoylcysteine decarboxylase/phosphopantothenate--cysteine ligase
MRVIVAASGGVAAVKTPALLRRLAEAGHEVRAAATDDALKFVTKLSLAVAAGSPVLDREAWFSPDGGALHIEWARWAEVLLIAPATADVIGSAATGRADDVISALILAGVPQVVWAPAMNSAMWTHPAVQRNVATLKGFGHRFLGPEHGTLAAQGEGKGVGRMLEPELLAARLVAALAPQDWAGRRVLVSAGPTREYLDPVRFLSNPSSGKMGYAVAEAARDRGAMVTLVSGPTALADPDGVGVIRVESAQEMLAALRQPFAEADLLVMTAAVADWQAAQPEATKQAKLGETQTLALVRTPDILETLAAEKRQQVMIGFAMETHEGVPKAADKARRKRLELICLNYPTRSGSVFGGDDNEVTLVTSDGATEALPPMSKRALAELLLDRAKALLPPIAGGIVGRGC